MLLKMPIDNNLRSLRKNQLVCKYKKNICINLLYVKFKKIFRKTRTKPSGAEFQILLDILLFYIERRHLHIAEVIIIPS